METQVLEAFWNAWPGIIDTSSESPALTGVYRGEVTAFGVEILHGRSLGSLIVEVRKARIGNSGPSPVADENPLRRRTKSLVARFALGFGSRPLRNNWMCEIIGCPPLTVVCRHIFGSCRLPRCALKKTSGAARSHTQPVTNTD